MIIAYRTNDVGGWYYGNKQQRAGKITCVKPGSPTERKLRPAHFPSECDWMVPNLVNPYGELSCRTSSKSSVPNSTNSSTP